MSSRAGWLGWIGGERVLADAVPDARRMVRDKDAEIAALKEQLTELAHTANSETKRARELAQQNEELTGLLLEAEQACSKLQAALLQADSRCAVQEERLSSEVGRAELASRLAASADERYREVTERWRNAERALVAARHQRTLAKEHQTELQSALSSAVQEREQLRAHNQRLQAQLKVATLDKDDAAAVSTRRLIQVEQRVKFAFDELECLGEDAHYLLRLACEALAMSHGGEVPMTLRDVQSRKIDEWVGRRFEGCATTDDVVAAANDVLRRLRLARLELREHLPLEVTIAPLDEDLLGADATVQFATGLLTLMARRVLSAELVVSRVQRGEDAYVVSLSVAGAERAEQPGAPAAEASADVGTS